MSTQVRYHVDFTKNKDENDPFSKNKDEREPFWKNTDENVPFWKKYDISFVTVFLLVYFNIAGLYGGYLCFTTAKWTTIFFECCIWFLSFVGVVMGAHKLWSHRAFKATRSLEVFLMLCHSTAMQFTVYKWVAIHRSHHRYSDTWRDPHNASQGLFYCHIGWSAVRQPGGPWDPAVLASMGPIRDNPVLSFQRRHSTWLLPTAALFIPTLLPLLWGEDLSTAWHVNLFRFIVVMHSSASVNSVGHTWGYRPYDSTIRACQHWLLAILTLGEGFHNFHHVFPSDYRGSEEDQRWTNVMAMCVEVCATLGLAKNLRVAGAEAVRRKREGEKFNDEGNNEW